MTKNQEKKVKKLWSKFADVETKYHAAWRKASTYEMHVKPCVSKTKEK